MLYTYVINRSPVRRTFETSESFFTEAQVKITSSDSSIEEPQPNGVTYNKICIKDCHIFILYNTSLPHPAISFPFILSHLKLPLHHDRMHYASTMVILRWQTNFCSEHGDVNHTLTVFLHLRHICTWCYCYDTHGQGVSVHLKYIFLSYDMKGTIGI